MKQNYEAYKALDKKVDALFDDKNFKEAITMLEMSYDHFPDYEYELKTYALFCYREDKNYEKCIDLLQEGVSKGYFYGLQWKGWDPVKSLAGWEKIEEKNNLNRAEAAKKSKMEYKVFLPENYNDKHQYPLFITLHGDGNGCNINDFSQEWQPNPLLRKGFIVAYVQSSHPECMGGYGWTSDYKKSREEIHQAFDLICDQYPIDVKRIIIGGFSGGSMASLNVMMNNSFDLKGIVALCPNETDDCTDENMRKAAERGRKMVLLEGEKSGEIPFHLQLMESAGKFNLPAKYIINKGAGHNVPEGFDKIIIEAVDFILE